VVDALFREAGVIRTVTLEELFDVAALLAHQPVPAGARVAILSNAGGPAILAADACESKGLVLAALTDAERVVIAPSNPLVSIAPVLSVPELRDAVEGRREDCVAVSPIIAGTTVKGPADRLMTELGHDASVVGVARLYAPLASRLVIDEADADLADAVAAEGIDAVVAPTMMYGPPEAAALARVVLS